MFLLFAFCLSVSSVQTCNVDMGALFCTKLTHLKLTKIAKQVQAILVTTKAREGALLLKVLVLFDNLLLMFW